MLVATIFFKVHQFCQQILKNLKFFPEIKKCRKTVDPSSQKFRPIFTKKSTKFPKKLTNFHKIWRKKNLRRCNRTLTSDKILTIYFELDVAADIRSFLFGFSKFRFCLPLNSIFLLSQITKNIRWHLNWGSETNRSL